MPRLTANEIAKAMQTAKPEKAAQNIGDPVRESVCYTTLGKEVAENSRDVFCKVVRVDDTLNYYILYTAGGKMYNPHGLYDESERAKPQNSRKQFMLRKVRAKIFNLYLKFLETKNQSWLTNAERESA